MGSRITIECPDCRAYYSIYSNEAFAVCPRCKHFLFNYEIMEILERREINGHGRLEDV